MLEIQDSRVSYDGAVYKANCTGCAACVSSKYKNTIIRALTRGNCRACRSDYRTDETPKNSDGKWISHCPKCGSEQAYTRKNHAKSSESEGWLCRSCRASSKNNPVGNERRLYNKFRKSANNRKIPWDITFEDFVGCYTGTCALTGWELSMDYGVCTASFDRVDSSKPYENGNIQWLHTMVNMSKNKYPQEKFIAMCVAIADKVKW